MLKRNCMTKTTTCMYLLSPFPLHPAALVLTGLMLCTITDGYIFGQMSGMIDTLKSEHSDVKFTETEISYITAVINISCIPGFLLATIVSRLFGRPSSITVLTLPIIAIWIMVYLAQTFIVLLITRILVGMCFGAMLFMCIVTAAEYAAPNVRGVYLNLVTSGGTALGTMLGHILSLFFHWRTVALIGIIPAALAALIPFFWVESPSYLASKGMFKECEISFRALHGNSKEAEKELRLLIELEMNKQKKSELTKTIFDFKKVRAVVLKRYFWNIGFLATMLNVYRALAAKVLFSSLAITMLQEITKTNDILKFTLLVDGFAVLGGFSSSYFISKIKMRTLLFSSATIANILLLALSACMYFKSENDIYIMWANCLLLALYFISINAGPYPVLEALFGEIYPLEIKGEMMVIFGVVGSLVHFLYIKYAPYMLAMVGYPGTFLFNVISMCVCLGYFWIVLPETKGRTLQELELYFKNNNSFKTADVEKDVEEAKVLI